MPAAISNASPHNRVGGPAETLEDVQSAVEHGKKDPVGVAAAAESVVIKHDLIQRRLEAENKSIPGNVEQQTDNVRDSLRTFVSTLSRL